MSGVLCGFSNNLLYLGLLRFLTILALWPCSVCVHSAELYSPVSVFIRFLRRPLSTYGYDGRVCDLGVSGIHAANAKPMRLSMPSRHVARSFCVYQQLSVSSSAVRFFAHFVPTRALAGWG